MVAYILASFADSLLHEGDYFNAITEYRRELFYGVRDSSLLFLKIGYTYYLRGKYDRSAYYFSLARDGYGRAVYMQALALVRGGDGKTALLLVEGDTTPLGREIRALALASTGRYKEALSVSDSAGMNLRLRPSPTPYVLLSYILPGSGHIALGRFKGGIMTALMNALSFAGAYYLLKRKLYYDLVLFTGTVLLRFYLGGVERVQRYFREDNLTAVDSTADSLMDRAVNLTAF